MVELNPNVSEDELESQKQNEFLVTEEEVQEGVEATSLNCKNVEDSDRFWRCKAGSSTGFKKTIMPQIDAVNVHPDDNTEIKKTRVSRQGISNVQVAQEGYSGEGDKLNITGTCRPSNSTRRGTFCELKVEDA